MLLALAAAALRCVSPPRQRARLSWPRVRKEEQEQVQEHAPRSHVHGRRGFVAADYVAHLGEIAAAAQTTINDRARYPRIYSRTDHDVTITAVRAARKARPYKL